MLNIFVAVAAIRSALAYTDIAMKDKIVSLPGAENLDVTFNQFSGYLDIPSTKHMHYWFVESMNNPAEDPIAFWTNGGPGCSGLLGFMTEMGPFQPNADLTLKLNDYAWNKVSNMVFIEAPCGVGFSYADDKEEALRPNDESTAQDNYALIQAFFDRFPEYRENNLYLSSESYGGHYLPTLAKVIVDQNSLAPETGEPVLNFKGFAVGNPYTTWYSGMPAKLETFWGHQLIDKPTWDAYYSTCVTSHSPHLADCAQYYLEMSSMIDLNVYALDYPVCLEDGNAAKGRMQRYWHMDHMLRNQSIELRRAVGLGDSKSDYEPCADNYMDAYLNQPVVKEAIHVNTDIKWSQCSYDMLYEMRDSFVSMTPIYNYLIDGGYGLDILVYSGDDDSQCATVGTQSWIWSLGYEVAGKKWQTYTVDGQTAGYLTTWKDTGLAFLTVHGAGHEVPTYKPKVALEMWAQYLKGSYTNR